MAFSLFGKKSEPPKKTDAKPGAGKTPAARPPAKPSASPAPKPAAPTDSGDESLDFSSYVPPPKTEWELPAEPAPAAAPLAVEKVAPVPQAPSAPAVVAAPPPAPAPKPLASPPPQMPAPAAPAPAPTPIPRRTVGEDVPVIEDTAILFANGQVGEALTKLARAVRGADLGADALQAWLMLFDLYQDAEKRVEFEALALEFTVKFERSPPVWIEAVQEEDPALATGGVGYCAVSGTLSEASAPALGKLRDAATRQRTVRLDFAKLQGLDGPGCGILRETLHAIRDAGTEVLLTGEAQLLGFLEEACQPGKIQTDGTVWALLLDVYRMLDLQEKFEEVAVNYAVTFEVSPPSWEPPGRSGAKGATAVSSKETSEQALVLSEELTGADQALAKQMQEWAAANHMLVIDMSRTRRVDFVTAGLMFNVMSKLHQAGTTIQIKGPNQLVNALFGVMGIGQVARIIPKK